MSAGETLWGVAGAAGGALLLSYALIVRSFVAPDGAATTSRADQARVMWGRWASERRPVFWLAWTVGTLVTASMYLVLLAAAAEDPGLKDFLVFGLFPLPAMLWSYGVLKADAAVANTAVVLTAAASMTLLLCRRRPPPRPRARGDAVVCGGLDCRAPRRHRRRLVGALERRRRRRRRQGRRAGGGALWPIAERAPARGRDQARDCGGVGPLCAVVGARRRQPRARQNALRAASPRRPSRARARCR